MFSRFIEHTSEIDQAFAVQLERFYGRSPSRSPSDDDGVIFALCEMIAPELPPRMKEIDFVLSDGIWSGCPDVFMVVASLA